MNKTGVIITRSAADFWGHQWPPDRAMMVGERPVTWAEIHHQRRERQRERLAELREGEPRRLVPAYIWTFRVSGPFYAGWWCYLVCVGGIERFGYKGQIDWGPLAESIMAAYPMGLFPLGENWERWMVALARGRPRRHPRDPRPSGSLVGWYDRERVRFALTRGQELPT